jgi:plastocyanin
MPWPARRLLALVAAAAFAAAAAAQAVAAPRAGTHAPAKKPRKAAKKARAVKLRGGVAWVPPAMASAARPPLTGAVASGGAAGGGPSGAGGPGAGGAGGPTGPGSTPTTPGLPTDPPTQQALGATVDERSGYTLRLSRTTLSAGPVVVQLINQGEDPHDLRIVRTGTSDPEPVDLPETGPGQQTTTTLTLKPGSYYLFCTLTTPKSHEQAGMRATLRVDP